MSKNIAADLLRFNGEIGPQYLDQDDTTSGPDGTMKPITREVLREMIVANFPDLQRVEVDNQLELPTDYPDATVAEELESIKQQQTEILQRLDGTFNTQVTGSNVEEIWRGVSIPANTFISEKFLFKGRKVGISYRGNVSRYFKIRMQPIDFNSGLIVGESIDLFDGSDRRSNNITVSLTLDVSSYSIFLENLESNAENTLDVRFFNITHFI